MVPSLCAVLVALRIGALAFRRFPPFMGLLGMYLGFILAALLAFALQGRWRILPVLPAVMVCLQLGYGLGVWLGLALPRVAEAPKL